MQFHIADIGSAHIILKVVPMRQEGYFSCIGVLRHLGFQPFCLANSLWEMWGLFDHVLGVPYLPLKYLLFILKIF